MFDYRRALASVMESHPDDELLSLYTPWGEDLDPENVLQEYPRPQMVRKSYTNLNGYWDYCITGQPIELSGEKATHENTEYSDKVNVNSSIPELFAATVSAFASASHPNPAPEPPDFNSIYASPDVYDPPEEWDGKILVPFSPEAHLSGVGRQLLPGQTLWYRRHANVEVQPGRRLLLHFEAVDFECSCFIDSEFVGAHQGGYAPFCFDITDLVSKGAKLDSGQLVGTQVSSPKKTEIEIALAVKDPSEKGVQPRGKQRLDRGSIWCSAQSGIWQTVWLESVPEVYVEALRIIPDADAQHLRVVATVVNASEVDVKLPVSVELFEDLNSGEGLRQTSETAVLPAQGFGEVELHMDVPDPHLWSTEDPFLYSLVIKVGADQVESYCAFRTFTAEVPPNSKDGRKVICLNHKPIFLKGILDQGYWPDGLLTAPADQALVYDIELARKLGFNLMRKHLKTENARWYYHCDRMGMLVWQDMINGGAENYSAFFTSHFPTVFSRWSNHFDDTHDQSRFGIDSDLAKKLWMQTTVQAVEHLRNFPCIAGWTVFNEGWGQFDANDMTDLMRLLDDTRLFDQTSGWYDQGGGDLVSEHNYFREIRVPKPRHFGDKRAPMISEFGGYAICMEGHVCAPRTYGYAVIDTEDQFKADVEGILDQANALEAKGLAGYVYTQLTDVEEEVNGLVTFDRRVVKL